MLRDAEHFRTRLGSLEGANDTSDFIVKLVKDKHVPKAPIPSPSAPEKEETTVNGNGTSGGATQGENGGEVALRRFFNSSEESKPS